MDVLFGGDQSAECALSMVLVNSWLVFHDDAGLERALQQI